MLRDLETLMGESAFEVVAEKLPEAAVDEILCEPTIVGMDSIFEEVWTCLGQESVGIIGIYGMGGVGKTTRLSQINKFLSMPKTFDVVMWVVVSKDLQLEKIHEQIGKKIGLFNESWKNKSEEEKASDVFKILSKKKFILLLDDIWERVDLMKVDEAARELFQKKVGEDTLNCHPDILELAKTVAIECDGLPLALTTIGRAMACKKTPQEWSYAIEVLKIRKSSSEFLEDFLIAKSKFIEFWMGEGLLDESDGSGMRNQGFYIIGVLLRACLLEEIQEDHVQMHDVIRDMALWMAYEIDNEKETYLVRAGAGLTEAPEIENWEREKAKLCLGGFCSKNCISSYKFGKEVAKLLRDVENIMGEGAFETVAERILEAVVDEINCDPTTVGMESIFEEVWKSLGKESVGIIGIYGMEGVGKTTLLTRINKKFVNAPKPFDVVVSVVVSRDLRLEKIQHEIGKRIGLYNESWTNRRF
ncbi:Disease resistance protein [Melia azedarach]|uniref:Disease resistance protein n=1 Tax=Melia azedarach TaxID=155640 RepID=A0ACC1Y8Y3_MELAZ|nr:Disease resistance protein [Melia azedarach]